MDLADQMRVLLETDLASPAAGREYPRADILATVLDPRLFFEHFETDFDLILVFKIKVAPTKAAISGTAGTSISYHWLTGFYDSDREVLRGIEVDTPIVTTTLVRGNHSNIIAKILNWQKRHIAQTVALIRQQRKRLVAPNEERLAWNGSDLFRNIENINVTMVPTGGTQNRIAFSHAGDIPVWTGQILRGQLDEPNSGEFKSRPDIRLNRRGSAESSQRVLTIFANVFDAGEEWGEPTAVLTVAAEFSADDGWVRTTVSSPSCVLVHADDTDFEARLRGVLSEIVAEISSRIRAAK
jgi:hypothetical protein